MSDAVGAVRWRVQPERTLSESAALPNEPFTLIVRPHGQSTTLIVLLEAPNCNGTSTASSASPAMIVHLVKGTAFGSFPQSATADHEFV